MPAARLCRLSPSAFAEPLVNSWAAWPTLLAPVPASLHLDRYQLPLLRSFIENPDVHADAARSPELMGGPFAALDPARVPDVEALAATTERTMAAHLRLARDLDAFQRRLVEHARGLTLEPYYEQLPPDLRGCVELMYDYRHRPSVRVIEPLIYRTPLYRPELQSWRIATLAHDRARPYFLNTPRLPEHGTVAWHVPFADPRIDDLFRLDVAPRPEHEIRDLLDVGESPLDSLICEAGPPVRPAWTEAHTRIRYFGHACVLVERSGQSVLVDPFVSVTPQQHGAARFTFADLPPTIDYVLVTHGHQDHFCLETLLRLRHRTDCLVVPRNGGMLYGDVSLKLMAERLGFRRVVELDVFDSLPLADGHIVGVPFLGEHSDIGHSKANALIAQRNAPGLNQRNFTAMVRLDHNRALAQLAEKTGTHSTRIRKASIWGNHSATQYPDLHHALVDGKPALSLVDQKWYAETFIPVVQQRGAAIIKARGQSSAASAASAAIDHVRDWMKGAQDGDWVSMAVPSDGSYGIPAGVIYGYPVTCKNGDYQIVQGLAVNEFSRQRMDATHKELLEERDGVQELI